MRTRTVILVVSTYLLSACSSGTGSASIEIPGTHEQDTVDSTPNQNVHDPATTNPSPGIESSTASPALNVPLVDSTPEQNVDDLATSLPNLEIETSTASPALNVRNLDQQIYDYAQLIPRDGIMPIYEPVFVSATQAPLLDEELVMGLTFDDESKAYPITVLRHREIVNDQLGGIPILVTW